MKLGDLLANRYRLDAVAGHGGMGTVYRATDTAANETVAVKVLHPPFGASPTFRERLRREARLAGAIDSRYVVRVHGYGEDGDTAFIVMECVGGEMLAERLRRAGTLELGMALGVAWELALALEAINAAGIVHRDLKPSNIALVDGRVKVLDFGIARQEGDLSLTTTGVYLGTPEYSAPERGDSHGDTRSDIYTIGVMLYEMLTGELPFIALQRHRLPQLHRAQEPPPLPPAVPNAVAAVVMRCLEKSPADRFQTPRTLAAALENALATLDLPVEPLGPSGESAERPGHGPDHREAATVALPDPSRVPNNLPVHALSFVGRRREVAEIRARLSQGRVLTLIGPGGCGKTRLAAQVAAEVLVDYPNGAWWVDLAPLADSDAVVQTVARAVGVRETPGLPLEQTLIDALRGRRLLLVLDNCEHLIERCAELAGTLLGSCAALRLLATSREPLGAEGEQVYGVQSLSLPDAEPDNVLLADALKVSDAGRLFCERAAAADPRFELDAANARSVAAICGRLGGIPLALELAVRWLTELSVDQLAKELERHFLGLTGRDSMALRREEMLRGVQDWAFARLSEPERIVLRRTAVFAGGFDLEAAQAICADASEDAPASPLVTEATMPSVLSTLSRRALVMGDGNPVARFRLLEPVRQYAAERLQQAGEATGRRDRHRDFFTDVAVRADGAIRGKEQEFWLARLDPDHDNMRAALGWSLLDRSHPAALRLAGSLMPYWEIRGYWSEGRTWLQRVIANAGDVATKDFALALSAAGILAFDQGDFATAETYFQRVLTLRFRIGPPIDLAATYNSLGTNAARQGKFIRARAMFAKALAIWEERSTELPARVALVSSNLGIVERHQGNVTRAKELFETSLKLRRELGEVGGYATTLSNLATVFLDQGEVFEARRRFQASLWLYRAPERRHREGEARSLMYLGEVAACMGRYSEAQRLLANSLELREKLGDRRACADTVYAQGNLAYRCGDLEHARGLYNQALAGGGEIGALDLVANIMENLGLLELREGNHAEASRLLDDSGSRQQRVGDRRGVMRTVVNQALLALAQGQLGQAAESFGRALRAAQVLQDNRGIIDCLAGLAQIATATGNPATGVSLIGSASSIRRRTGLALTPVDRAAYEAMLGALHAALGPASFAEQSAAGAALDQPAALQRALDFASGVPRP